MIKMNIMLKTCSCCVQFSDRILMLVLISQITCCTYTLCAPCAQYYRSICTV